MKKDQIKVGGLYSARISGRYVTVRVDAIRQVPGYVSGSRASRDQTVFDVTNLATGRTTTFRSAAKFRGEVKSRIEKEVERTPDGGMPIRPTYFGDGADGTDPLRPEAAPEVYDEETEQWVDPNPAVNAAAEAGDFAEVDRIARTDETANMIRAMFEAKDRADLMEGEQRPDPRSDTRSGLTDSVGAMTAGSAEPFDSWPVSGGSASGADVEGEQRSDPTTHTAAALSATNHSTETASAESAAPSATIPAQAVPAPSGLASMIVAARGEAAKTAARDGLTTEQADIVDTAKVIEEARTGGQRVLVIGAGAGTGKTYTLKKLEEVLRGRGQYTAFNTSLVAESKAKFRRAACNTTHSLAFRAVGKDFAHRLNGPRVRSHEIAARLGIGDLVLECGEPYPKDSPEWCEAAGGVTSLPYPATADFAPRATKRIKASWLAGQVVTAIWRFCMSADPQISGKHVKWIDGIDARGERANNERVRAYLEPFLRAAWADLADPKGTQMPFAHDVYVKCWQLGTGKDRPVIAADYILLDEAQDTAPVMLDILRQQEHALLILVGDDNQQIYEWRGAVNAMASFPGAPRRLLSQSFRFGQAVADVANAVLATLEEPTDLVMRGLPTIPTRVCPVAEPRCYLYRTNAGAVGRLMAARAAGKRGHLIGGSDEVVRFCEAAMELQAGKGTGHPELGCFQNWGEVQAYSKEDEGADLRLMVKLIDDFGASEIRDALRDMPDEDDADLVLSTAHRSKGREWSSVRLGQDFPTANKLGDAERRLVYVAVTRAQEELDISDCPTFCGGWDGIGEQKQWVPGIEITYTVPMPTEEELAAHRASKATGVKPAAPTADPRPRPNVGINDSGRMATPAPAPRPAAPEAPNTWARGRDGNTWLVRGPAGQSGWVTVTKKNGDTSRVKIGAAVWEGDGVALYEVE